jgi:hypothetical protein
MSALEQAASTDPWAEKQLHKLRAEIEQLQAENDRLREDAERYRRWKAVGLSFSNGFYHLSIYVGHDEMEWTDADDVVDNPIELTIDAARGKE